MKKTHKKYVLTKGCGLALLTAVSLSAGTFTESFDSLQLDPGDPNFFVPPTGTAWYGNVASGISGGYDLRTGGVNNSGVLKLTTAVNSHQSSFIIEDLDAGAYVNGIDANWKVRVGGGSGTPADGFSFVFGQFGAGLGGTDGTFGEEGPGTIQGLTIAFDIYNNDTADAAPSFELKWNGTSIRKVSVPIATMRSGTAFWDVSVHVDPDGTLDLRYNNNLIMDNQPIALASGVRWVPQTGARFAWGARTGGLNENQFIDDISITTTTTTAPYVKTLTPAGAGAHPEGIVFLELVDLGTQVNPDSISVKIDDVEVPITKNKVGDTTTVIGNFAGILATGNHTLALSYADNSPTPVVTTQSQPFSVGSWTVVPTDYAQAGGADTTKPGFTARLYQMPTARTPGDNNTVGNAERALAGGYIDPTTGQPMADVKDPTPFGADGFFVDENVLNWSENQEARGVFQVDPFLDEPVPGIPGTTFSDDNYVAEIWAYLDLPVGVHRFWVNSDDGFRFSTARGARDVLGTELGRFNGGRGASGTPPAPFDFEVTQAGIYPIRLAWWEGGGDSSVELFMLDPATGQPVLVNDTASPVKAFRAANVTRPAINRVRPEVNQNFTMPDADLIVDIADGTIPVNSGSIKVFVDGVEVTGAVTTANGVNSFLKAGSINAPLSPGSHTNTVIYSYTDGGNTVSVTNSWIYNVLMHGTFSAASKVTAEQVPGTGFEMKVHQLARTANTTQGDSDRFPGDGNRMPRPEVQLAEGFINTATGQPFPNVAIPDPADQDFVYLIADVLNFNSGLTGTAPNRTITSNNSGVFVNDLPMPGLGDDGATERATMSNGGLDNYVAEITTYLELKAGSYSFAVNSDDGFVASTAPNVHDTFGTILGFFNGGRGNASPVPQPTGNPNIVPGSNTGNTVFAALVPEDGIYPVRILYWQGGGGVNLEVFSIDPDSGVQTLLNDVANGGIVAHTGYTGPTKAWVKNSVTPTPWDNKLQQDAPGILQFLARTPASVDGADPYNALDNDRPWADVTVGVILGDAAGKTIRMLFDGAEVTPTLTTAGTDVTVSYTPSLLSSNSTHTVTLIYEGVSNTWSFVAQPYTTLPVSEKKPATDADPVATGFLVKIAQSATARGDGNNTVLAAEKQLAGVPANVAVANPDRTDGAYTATTINYNNTFNAGGDSSGAGNFQDNTLTFWPFPEVADAKFPGLNETTLTGNARRENFSAEVFAYLQLPAGYTRLGLNGDDGVAASLATPGVTNGPVLYSVNRGGGSADFPFSVFVTEAGLYPVRIVYYNGGGGGNLEFFSVDENGVKILVNDATNPKAIKAYYALTSTGGPTLAFSVTGNQLTITWTGGGELQSAPAVTGPWTGSGDSDGSFTDTIPDTGGMKFYRVAR